MQIVVVSDTGSSQPQTVSVDMNGTNEAFIRGEPKKPPMGFGNVFTYSQWTRANEDFTPSQVWMTLENNDLLNRMDLDAFITTGAPVFLIRDSAGDIIKRFRWNSQIPVNGTWVMMTFTWDGTDLLGYFDGVEDASPTMLNNNSGSRIDTQMCIGVGNTSAVASLPKQNLMSGAFWNVALSAAEILEMYNSGVGGDFDLGADSGNYVSSANLMHWWRFGHNRSDIGRDYGKAAILIDMMQNASNIDASDIVNEVPP